MKKIILALLVLIPALAFSQSEIKNNWILNINANRIAWHASGDTIMKWRNDSILFYKPTNISGAGGVSSVSRTNGYGISASVANATTTPNITIALDSATVFPAIRATIPSSSFTLANGNGTTASGSSVNIGGSVNANITLTPTTNATYNFSTGVGVANKFNNIFMFGDNSAQFGNSNVSYLASGSMNYMVGDATVTGHLAASVDSVNTPRNMVYQGADGNFYKAAVPSGSTVDTGRGIAQIPTGYQLNKVRDSVQANIDTKQPLDADLTSIAALSTTSYGRALLVEANATSLKTNLSLENVSNTSDATKNSATATLTNKTLTAPVINSPTGIVKGDVGLGNVDNTSDATKNSATATLTNKTITSPVINTGVSGSAIDDDITLAANSSTLLPTQHAVRDYVAKRSGSVYLSSNFTTSNTTATSTNLLFAAEANTNYTVTVTGTASKNASAGVKVAIDAPVGSTIKGFQTGGTSSLSTAMTNSLISTVGLLGSAFATGTDVEVPFVMQFVVHVSSTAGNITLQAASVTSGTTTIYADTKLEWRKSTGL